jgi:hypothetical protein
MTRQTGKGCVPPVQGLWAACHPEQREADHVHPDDYSAGLTATRYLLDLPEELRIQHLFQKGLHGIRPDTVSLFGGMNVIGHDLGR